MTLENDHRRAGFLSHGSLLTVTRIQTGPRRCSGQVGPQQPARAPPPPPAARHPGAPERGAGGKPASVRERLEQHRKNPMCEPATARGPLGFALENFDAIGRWRTVEAGAPIDASGTVARSAVRGPGGLRLCC